MPVNNNVMFCFSPLFKLKVNFSLSSCLMLTSFLPEVSFCPLMHADVQQPPLSLVLTQFLIAATTCRYHSNSVECRAPPVVPICEAAAAPQPGSARAHARARRIRKSTRSITRRRRCHIHLTAQPIIYCRLIPVSRGVGTCTLACFAVIKGRRLKSGGWRAAGRGQKSRRAEKYPLILLGEAGKTAARVSTKRRR